MGKIVLEQNRLIFQRRDELVVIEAYAGTVCEPERPEMPVSRMKTGPYFRLRRKTTVS